MASVRCPSCRSDFDVAGEVLAQRATVACARCGRVIVVRGAQPGGPPAEAGDEGSDPVTQPVLEPVDADELPTEIGVAGARLSLPEGKRVSVVALSGPDKGTVRVLDRPRLVFGRAAGAVDVVVSDPEASRTHAALECRGARIVLRDLDSRHGTFLGDQRVSSREVEDGSEFRIGSTSYLLLVKEA